MDEKLTAKTLAAKYRISQGTVGAANSVIPIQETCRCLSLKEQQDIFGTEIKGSKVRIVVIDAGKTLNGNIYSPEILDQSLPLFEGTKVYYDHKDRYDREVRDLAGELVDLEFEKQTQRLTATFKVLEADGWLRSVLVEAPHLIEFSIFVWCHSTSNADGSETVDHILKVRSVDIVPDAAGGGKVLNILEGVNPQPPTPEETQVETKTKTEKDVSKKTEAEVKMEAALAKKEEEGKLKMEKQMKDLTAKFEAMEKSNTDLQARLDAKDVEAKVAADKAVAKAEAAKAKELADLKAENLKLQGIKVLEDYFTANREGLKPSIEKAIRKSVESMQEVTTEKLAVVRATLEEMAAEFVKDFAVKKTDDLDKGIPAEGKTEGKKEDKKEEATQKFAESMIFGIMGVEQETETKDKTETK